ncbi:MAG: nuclear transport factor 2 family protein [Myxococcaceae bacterium]
MRRLRARAGMLALVVAMSGAAWAKGEAKGESKKAQKQVSEVQTFKNEFQTAWNEGDFAAIKKMYSENAVAVSPEGNRSVGRDQIVLSEQEAKTQGDFKGTTSNFQVESVRPLTQDLALVSVKQQVAGLDDPSIPSEYDIVAVLEKHGRDWKIVDQRAFPSRDLAIGGAGQECPPPGTGGAGQGGV